MNKPRRFPAEKRQPPRPQREPQPPARPDGPAIPGPRFDCPLTSRCGGC